MRLYKIIKGILEVVRFLFGDGREGDIARADEILPPEKKLDSQRVYDLSQERRKRKVTKVQD